MRYKNNFVELLLACSLTVNVFTVVVAKAANADVTSTEFNTVTDNAIAKNPEQHASLDVFEALHRTLHSVEKLVKNLLREDAISESSAELLSELTSSAEQALRLISLELLDLGNALFKRFFNRLAQATREFAQMSQEISSRVNGAVTHLNFTIMNQTEKIDRWATEMKHELRTINETQLYQHGCKQVDNFVASSTKLLQSCCKITIRPLKSLCWKSRSIFTSMLSLLVDIFERIQFCIEDSESYANFMLPCLHVAYDDIGRLIKRAAALRHHVQDALPLKVLISQSCLSIVLVQIEEQHSELSNNLTAMK